MECGYARLTVWFADPFWVGVYEREAEGRLEVCRHTFGAEPKDGEVWQWLLSAWRGLDFSPAVEAPRRPSGRENPKRVRRQARNRPEKTGVGTKAQQALQLRQEHGDDQPDGLLLEGREAVVPDVPDAPEVGQDGDQGHQDMPPGEGHDFFSLRFSGASGVRQMTMQARMAPMQMAMSATLKAGQCHCPT